MPINLEEKSNTHFTISVLDIEIVCSKVIRTFRLLETICHRKNKQNIVTTRNKTTLNVDFNSLFDGRIVVYQIVTMFGNLSEKFVKGH